MTETRQFIGETSIVKESEIWQACDRLAAENKHDFSCKDVRKELGHGSMTTIHRFVKSWRDAHPVSPDLDGTPSEQFLAAFKSELKRAYTAREDKFKVRFVAMGEDNEYLYKVLGETEEKLADTEKALHIHQEISESQKLQIETLKKSNEEQIIAISDLRDKQLKAHESLGRLEIRLERIPFLEKQNGDIQASLEKERIANTALVAELAASQAILAHLKDPPQRTDYVTRNMAAQVSDTPSLDKQSVSLETDGRTETLENLVAQEIHTPKCQSLSDNVIAVSSVAISNSGPMSTKDIHSLLIANEILCPEQMSVKSLAATLRGSAFLTFDTSAGSWRLSKSEQRNDGARVGEKHEAT